MYIRSGVINTKRERVIISFLCPLSYLYFSFFFLIERPSRWKPPRLSITRENKYSVCKHFLCNLPRTASERLALGSPRVLRFWSADRDDCDELPTDCIPREVADGFAIQFRKIYRIRDDGMCFRTMDGIKAIRIRESQFNPGRVSHHWAEENCWVIVLQYSDLIETENIRRKCPRDWTFM